MTGNQNVYLDITPNFLNYFSITTIDFEHTFSLYKHILSNRRYSFQEQNVDTMYIIINFKSEKLFL
jgi:hypothetical protein